MGTAGLFTPDDPRINRQGRPRRGKTLVDALEKYARRRKKDGIPYREALAQELWTLALNPTKDQTQLAAIKYIFDRIDGKPIETVQQQFEEGTLSPIVILAKKDIPQEYEVRTLATEPSKND